jgi:hypothetical protein
LDLGNVLSLILHGIVVGNSPLSGHILNNFLFFIFHDCSLVWNIFDARFSSNWLSLIGSCCYRSS